MKTHLTLFFALFLTYFTSPLSAQTLPDYLPTDGLVGWWPFNGNANDESGNGNNGVVNGATLAEDRFGNVNNAYYFDGNDFINVGNNPILKRYQTNFTISAWVKPTLFSTLFDQSILSNRGNSCQGSKFGLSGSQTLGPAGKLILVTAGGVCADYVCSSSQVSAINYQHVYLEFIYNSNQSIAKLYVNDILVNTDTLINNMTDPASQNTYFGYESMSSPNSSFYFNGFIDDIAIYNRILTTSERQALFATNYTDINSNQSSTTVPAFINYQAVARNAGGDPLANADVQVRFTLLADSLGGATEYSETHALTTNALGLFTTAFGAGTPEVSTFDSIAWDNSNKFLRVELNAGNGYIDMGTQQLLSVPFALRSQSAAAIRNEHLPVFNDNVAAVAAGLAPGTMYRTSSGVLMVVY
ncbi:MAG: LamG domain-containing protein [Flavobacteriales bacterium]|jgi:hypothetical protein